MTAKVNKFMRSQETAAAWNAGKIKLPHAQWATDLATKVQSFTGRYGEHDDDVDALVSLYDFAIGHNWELPSKLAYKRVRA